MAKREALSTLLDVNLSGVADTNVLAYSSGTAKWVPSAAAATGPPGPPGPALTNRGRTYLRMAGVDTGYTTPDTAQLDITGAIDLRALVIPDSWATGSVQCLITKWAGTQCSYQLAISTDGHLAFVYTANGSTQRTIQSLVLLSPTIGLTTTSGLPVWLRAYAIPDDGTGKAKATFYYSQVLSPGVSDWTLLDAITNVNPGPWFSSTSNVYLGQVTAGTSTYTGRYYEAQIYDDTTLRASFDARGASDPPATFTDTLGKVWTPRASATLLTDEVSDWDFRDKTVHFSRMIGGPQGVAVTVEIPVVSADRSVDIQNAALSAGGYVCDGTADEVQIQAAIDALAAITKPSLTKFAAGVVKLVGQKFVTTTDILGKSGIKLIGMGSSNTVIIPALTWAGTNIVALNSVNVEQFSLESMAIDGRKADGVVTTAGWNFDNTGGSFIVGPDAKHLVQDVIVHDCSGSGGIMGINCRGAKIINTDYYSCGGHGFYLSATDCKVSTLRTSACGTDDGAMAYYGIGVIGSNNQITGFKANFQRGHNVAVFGTVINLNGQSQDAWGAGLWLDSTSALVQADVNVDSCAMFPQGGVTGSDANIYDNGTQNTIRGISRDRGFAESQVDISGNVGNRTAYGVRYGSAVNRPNHDLQTRNTRVDSMVGTRTGIKARIMVQTLTDNVSDVQVVTMKNATGGTFKLTDVTSGQQTANITFSTTAATLQSNAQTALQALAALGGNVTVNSASFTYQFKILMGGTLANAFRSTFTIQDTGLTGSSISLQVNHATEGGARTSEARIANATVVTT